MDTRANALEPIAKYVEIIGEPYVGGTLTGSYFYQSQNNLPQGISLYKWTLDGTDVEGAITQTFRLKKEHIGRLVRFWVTPVDRSGIRGQIVSSEGKTIVSSSYQNITDEESTNSFMKQNGDFSFHIPEPADGIFTSTAGAFALLDGNIPGVLVRGKSNFGEIVPEDISAYLKNNPAVKLFSTERDFAAVVNIGSSNSLLVWGLNIPAAFPTVSLDGIKYVYSNRSAFAFIYESPEPGSDKIGAIGWNAAGGTVPPAIHLALQQRKLTPKAIYATEYAFCLLAEDPDGEGKVLAWGDSASGGTISTATQTTLDSMNIKKIISNASAFCAIGADGYVVTWGNTTNGGVIPTATLDNIMRYGGAQTVVAARAAFCAVTNGTGTNKRAYSWGNPTQGGSMTQSAIDMSTAGNIEICKAAVWAFCMINKSGKAEAWGDLGTGGSLSVVGSNSIEVSEDIIKAEIKELFAPEESSAATESDSQPSSRAVNVPGKTIELYANDRSFLILSKYPDGRTLKVITWGDASAGGAMSTAVRQALNASYVQAVYCTNGAYGVIADQGRTKGTAIVWGAGPAGAAPDAGEVPSTFRKHLLRDVVELYSIKRFPPVNPTEARVDPSFAARKDNGAYVLWGGNVETQYLDPATFTQD